MTFVAEVGNNTVTVQTCGEMTIEWKLHNFFSLSDKASDFYRSPVFSFADARWCLNLVPNGDMVDSSEGFMGLRLERMDEGPPKTLHYRLGIRSSDGVEKKVELEYEFREEKTVFGYPKFKSRSELEDQKAAFMPNNTLTVTCDLRSDGAITMVSDNEQLKKESLMEQIRTLQNTVENSELESEDYKKQISILESEKSSIAERYECLLEEKITTISGLEKDNEQLKKEVEEQIKTLQKTVENHQLESENYKKEISALKSSGLRKVLFFGTLLFIILEFLTFFLVQKHPYN